MRKVNVYLLSTLCMFLFLNLNAQEVYEVIESETPRESCLIPIEPEDELECDLEGANGDLTVVEPEIEALGCPDEKSMVHKETVIVRKPNVTEAKKVLDAYIAKHKNSQAMKDVLKTLFSCAECILPDVDPCVQEVEITSLTYSRPKKISTGVYRSTITVKFKAKCVGCELSAPIIGFDTNSPVVGRPFPNPVENNLHLSVELPKGTTFYRVSVIDIVGNELLSQKFEASSNSKSHIDFDVSSLESGNYILRVHLNNDELRSFRFTKI